MAKRTSPRVLLALLLTGLVAADAHLASMDTSMSMMARGLVTSDSDCLTSAQAACEADEECTRCAFELSLHSDTCDPGDGASCSEVQGALCCTLAEEDRNCENNDLFDDVIECIEDSTGSVCDFNIRECTGAADRARSWGVSIILCSSAVAGVLVATFGFVV